MNPKEFETEEEWFDEIEERQIKFLEQLIESIEESSLSIVHYIAIHRLEIFSIFLSVYFFAQSASKQDIEAIKQDIEAIDQNVQSLHEKITPPDSNQERNELLENKLNKLIEALGSVDILDST